MNEVLLLARVNRDADFKVVIDEYMAVWLAR